VPKIGRLDHCNLRSEQTHTAHYHWDSCFSNQGSSRLAKAEKPEVTLLLLTLLHPAHLNCAMPVSHLVRQLANGSIAVQMPQTELRRG
jgi:hypothetical protein